MSMRTILVTGFEPFGGEAVNPSQELAKILDGHTVGGCAVRAVVLPVENRGAREMVAAALEDPELAAILHLGLAGGRARLALEQVAVNAMDYPLADNAGVRITGEPCVAGGPAAYFATLPLRAMHQALTAEGIPAYVSYTAGTYLCNQALYWTLHEVSQRSLPVRAGFIHVPWLPSMVVAHNREEPSMDLPLMRRGVEIALRIAATA